MPLQTSKGYNLQADILGSFERGQDLKFKADQREIAVDLQNQKLGDQKRMRELRKQALGVDDNPQVKAIISAPSSQDEEAILLSTGLDTPEKKKEAQNFAEKTRTATDEQLTSMINERVGDIVARGGDPKDTMQLLNMTPQQARQELEGVSMIVDRDAVRQMFAIDPKSAASFLDSLEPNRRAKISGVRDDPAQQKQKLFKQFLGMPEGSEKQQFGTMIGAISKTPSTSEKVDLHQRKKDIDLKLDPKITGKKEDEKLKSQIKNKPELEKRTIFAKNSANWKAGRPKFKTKIASAKASQTILEATSEQIKKHVNGLTTQYGVALSGIPGSEARTLAKQLDTLRAHSAFSTLIDLKSSGGTLGAISGSELVLLESLLGSLDQGGDSTELLRVVDQVVNSNLSSIRRLETEFDATNKIYNGSFDEFESSQTNKPTNEMSDKELFE